MDVARATTSRVIIGSASAGADGCFCCVEGGSDVGISWLFVEGEERGVLVLLYYVWVNGGELFVRHLVE